MPNVSEDMCFSPSFRHVRAKQAYPIDPKSFESNLQQAHALLICAGPLQTFTRSVKLRWHFPLLKGCPCCDIINLSHIQVASWFGGGGGGGLCLKVSPTGWMNPITSLFIYTATFSIWRPAGVKYTLFLHIKQTLLTNAALCIFYCQHLPND